MKKLMFSDVGQEKVFDENLSIEDLLANLGNRLSCIYIATADPPKSMFSGTFPI